MADHAPAHPPRARLAFRVGVVGHRLDKLPKTQSELDAIDERIRAVLEAVDLAIAGFCATDEAGLYNAGPPLLRAVSPLAEGTDRMFAAAALDRKYELCVPMPFLREDYERDFTTPESLAGFRGLIARAAAETALTTFELDQSRKDQPAAYGAAGRLVVNQSDLLVAIWDGDEGKRGGTVETMKEAVSFRVPVLRIDAKPPFGWSLIRSADEIDACIDRHCTPEALDAEKLREEVADIVRAEIALPRAVPGREALYAPAAAAEPEKLVRTYFGEGQPRLSPYFLWKPFRDFVGDFRVRLPRIRVRDFGDAAAAEWPAGQPEIGVGAWVNARLRGHFAWADGLADYYADAHRSGFIATSMLAALAVLLALSPLVLGIEGNAEYHGLEIGLIFTEAVVLSLLFATIGRANAKRWHERWLEYRMLAEWVRQLRFMIPMGGGRPLMRTPAHLADYGDPLRSWIYWHVRAVARETGIPNAKADPAYVRDCLAFLAKTVGDEGEGQLGFHRNSMLRGERIHRRLHATTATLVFLTIAGVVLHLLIGMHVFHIGKEDAETLNHVLLLIAAGFPALSAALANIDNQGEFARLSKRSRAMADAFKRFHDDVLRLTGRIGTASPPSMADATALATRVATSMVEEVVDWRIVAIDLPHEPG